jgi:hypothetical protein
MVLLPAFSDRPKKISLRNFAGLFSSKSPLLT